MERTFKRLKKLKRLILAIFLLPIFPILSLEGAEGAGVAPEGGGTEGGAAPEGGTTEVIGENILPKLDFASALEKARAAFEGNEGQQQQNDTQEQPIDPANQSQNQPQEQNQPDINAMMQAYQEQMNQQMNQRFEELFAKMQGQAQPQEGENSIDGGDNNSQPEGQMTDEQLLEIMYDKPSEFLQAIENRVLAKMQGTLKPVEQIIQKTAEQETQDAWNQKAAQFAETHADFAEHTEAITQILQEKPYLLQQDDALDIAYEMAKGRKYQAVDYNQLMQDPNFINTVKSNPDFMKNIVSHHINNVKNVQQNAPNLMNGGGQQPAMPVNKPTNFAEARKIVESMYSN